jgi:hypothetical protein
MKDELEGLWKEGAVPCFKELFRYSSGGTEENHEKPKSE